MNDEGRGFFDAFEDIFKKIAKDVLTTLAKKGVKSATKHLGV